MLRALMLLIVSYCYVYSAEAQTSVQIEPTYTAVDGTLYSPRYIDGEEVVVDKGDKYHVNPTCILAKSSYFLKTMVCAAEVTLKPTKDKTAFYISRGERHVMQVPKRERIIMLIVIMLLVLLTVRSRRSRS